MKLGKVYLAIFPTSYTELNRYMDITSGGRYFEVSGAMRGGFRGVDSGKVRVLFPVVQGSYFKTYITYGNGGQIARGALENKTSAPDTLMIRELCRK